MGAKNSRDVSNTSTTECDESGKCERVTKKCVDGKCEEKREPIETDSETGSETGSETSVNDQEETDTEIKQETSYSGIALFFGILIFILISLFIGYKYYKNRNLNQYKGNMSIKSNIR